MKYKALREDKDIFYNFLEAIFTKHLSKIEKEIKVIERNNLKSMYKVKPTKEQLQELRKHYNNKQISELTGWSYGKVNYYVTKYKIGWEQFE